MYLGATKTYNILRIVCLGKIMGVGDLNNFIVELRDKGANIVIDGNYYPVREHILFCI